LKVANAQHGVEDSHARNCRRIAAADELGE
jgi:hypothetical protein